MSHTDTDTDTLVLQRYLYNTLVTRSPRIEPGPMPVWKMALAGSIAGAIAGAAANPAEQMMVRANEHAM